MPDTRHSRARPRGVLPGALPAGRVAVCGVLAALGVAPSAVASGTTSAVASGAPSAYGATHGSAPTKPLAAATLEGCQTAAQQSERAATFVGEMTAVPGTARMLMRIDVLERSGSETDFRTVTYPGLGNWLRAAAGVKTYKNLDRVTDLAAPAEYRAAIRFHWLNARGRLLKSSVLHTPICTQPLPADGEAAAPAAPAASQLAAP